MYSMLCSALHILLCYGLKLYIESKIFNIKLLRTENAISFILSRYYVTFLWCKMEGIVVLFITR